MGAWDGVAERHHWRHLCVWQAARELQVAALSLSVYGLDKCVVGAYTSGMVHMPAETDQGERASVS